MKKIVQLITMGFFLSLFGCKQPSNEKQQQYASTLPEITSKLDTSEGFSDIFLVITNNSKTDSTEIYTGQGIYKGKVVGLKLEINSKIPQGITADGEINSKSGFIRNGIKFMTLGQQSDDFITALSELYEHPQLKIFSKNKISATLFSLNQHDTYLDKKGYYKFKLFFNDDGDEDAYAEMFLNINTTEQIIEFHEKDHEYRMPLLKAFTTQL
ncbi:MAG: hypothetical protein RL596_768 [Bacteroidota bacterium]|jgi:hypothetical protein